MKIERYHWRHYFGGLAFLFFIFQVLTGVFLTLFYHPHLHEAYASIQGLYREFPFGAWIRDAHRWFAFFIFAAIVIHIVRSLLRREFVNYERRTIWLTGTLLLLPILALLVTGLILPWEWKGYWLMEMVPNYLGSIPLVGPPMKAFMIEFFTMSRNLIAHVVILPVIALILIDFHVFAKLRRRSGGIPRYLLKHALLIVPFFVAVGLLALYIPMPSEDPEIIPMPLEGTDIPAPEWFYLILLRPFMHFKGQMAPFLGIYLPFALFLAVMALPYFFKGREKSRERHEADGEPVFRESGHFLGITRMNGLMKKMVSFLIVFLTAGGLFGLLFLGAHESPTLGCNSCHNVYLGQRMGVPPEAFKNRNIVPLLDDSQWMVEHWFYPQVTW